MALCCSAFATSAVALSSIHDRQPVRAFSRPLVVPQTVVAGSVRSLQQSWKLAPRALSQTGGDIFGGDRVGGDRKVLKSSFRGPFKDDAWLHAQEMQLLHRTPKREALEIAKDLLIKEGLDVDQVDGVALKLVQAHHDTVEAGFEVFDSDDPLAVLMECGVPFSAAFSVAVGYVGQIVKKRCV